MFPMPPCLWIERLMRDRPPISMCTESSVRRSGLSPTQGLYARNLLALSARFGKSGAPNAKRGNAVIWACTLGSGIFNFCIVFGAVHGTLQERFCRWFRGDVEGLLLCLSYSW